VECGTLAAASLFHKTTIGVSQSGSKRAALHMGAKCVQSRFSEPNENARNGNRFDITDD
jgi:hypothetical protein